jgi:CheY-like chemotaxis protein
VAEELARILPASRRGVKSDRLLVFAVGTVVTIFLSNDATAVVLTPAVAAVAKTAKAEEPLPYLFICALVANAASFVLPISNPANLVIYGSHMPALLQWLPQYALPSALSILATFFALRWTQRDGLFSSVSNIGRCCLWRPGGAVLRRAGDGTQGRESMTAAKMATLLSAALIVEDDQLMAAAIGTMVQELGYNICLADSVEAALEFIKATTFNLIVSDIELPGLMNGADLAALLHSSDAPLPIILMTGSPAWADSLADATLFCSSPSASPNWSVRLLNCDFGKADRTSKFCRAYS